MAVWWAEAPYIRVVLFTEAVSDSEMPVHLYQTTWRCNPEDSQLQTHPGDNLKPHLLCSAKQEIPVHFTECLRPLAAPILSEMNPATSN
jgi:hypothetical protein